MTFKLVKSVFQDTSDVEVGEKSKETFCDGH